MFQLVWSWHLCFLGSVAGGLGSGVVSVQVFSSSVCVRAREFMCVSVCVCDQTDSAGCVSKLSLHVFNVRLNHPSLIFMSSYMRLPDQSPPIRFFWSIVFLRSFFFVCFFFLNPGLIYFVPQQHFILFALLHFNLHLFLSVFTFLISFIKMNLFSTKAHFWPETQK